MYVIFARKIPEMLYRLILMNKRLLIVLFLEKKNKNTFQYDSY